MRFHTLVGILPHEREIPQPIEIDLCVQLRDGTSIVDYSELYAMVRSLVEAGAVDYLETLSEQIADAALRHSARIRSARAAVRKPNVALGGPLDYAEVATELSARD